MQNLTHRMLFSLLALALLWSTDLHAQKLTVNKSQCTNASFQDPPPNADLVSPQTNPVCKEISTAVVGEFVVYYITIRNTDTNAGPITLKDMLPPNFVPTDVLCSAAGTGTNCGTLPPLSAGIMSFTGLMVPQSVSVTLEIRGYFTAPSNDARNTATGTPHKDAGVTNTDFTPLSVTSGALKGDLSVDKTVTPTTGSNGTVYHVVITVKNTGLTRVYTGGLVHLVDKLEFITTGQSPLSYKYTNIKCTVQSATGGSCPSFSSTQSGALEPNAYTYFNWNGAAYLDPKTSSTTTGDTVTIEYDIVGWERWLGACLVGSVSVGSVSD